MTDLNLTLKKTIPAPPEVVFDAWTTPEHMARWFSPMTTASVPKLELRVGGEYQVDMHGDGKDHVHTGKYTEVSRPNKLAFTWISEGTGNQETLVTLEFAPDGSGTALTLTHERFADEKACENHEKGWTAILEKLAAQISQ
jgi:uncharacterized protein YndB with AHSA1/START domain